MQIKEFEKYAEFADKEKYLTEKSVKKLKEAAEEKFGKVYALEFDTFRECYDGNFDTVLGNMQDPTVLQVYWQKRFADVVQEFVKAVKNMTLPQTADELTASKGLLSMSWDESILVFCQQFFALHSYKDAGKLTLGEILIAKKAAYNREKFQRQMTELQRKKLSK